MGVHTEESSRQDIEEGDQGEVPSGGQKQVISFKKPVGGKNKFILGRGFGRSRSFFFVTVHLFCRQDYGRKREGFPPNTEEGEEGFKSGGRRTGGEIPKATPPGAKGLFSK